jgi:hypothetical protein
MEKAPSRCTSSPLQRLRVCQRAEAVQSVCTHRSRRPSGHAAAVRGLRRCALARLGGGARWRGETSALNIPIRGPSSWRVQRHCGVLHLWGNA